MRQPTPIYRIKLNGSGIDQQTWLAKKVTHSMVDGGFTTALELEMSTDPASARHRSRFRGSSK